MGLPFLSRAQNLVFSLRFEPASLEVDILLLFLPLQFSRLFLENEEDKKSFFLQYTFMSRFCDPLQRRRRGRRGVLSAPPHPTLCRHRHSRELTDDFEKGIHREEDVGTMQRQIKGIFGSLRMFVPML